MQLDQAAHRATQRWQNEPRPEEADPRSSYQICRVSKHLLLRMYLIVSAIYAHVLNS